MGNIKQFCTNLNIRYENFVFLIKFPMVCPVSSDRELMLVGT